MSTSLTPDFWRLFAVLLVMSTAVTFVVSAVLDAPAVRLRERCRQRRLPAGRADSTRFRAHGLSA